MKSNTSNRPAREKGIAFCGLACCLCSHSGTCPGCQAGGCDIHSWCKNYRCCREQGLEGCWECDRFPCQGGMLDKVRVRAFARFAREYGTEQLIHCLLQNESDHIIYHYDGQLVGDYDQAQSEEEVLDMILWGRTRGGDGIHGDQT